MSSLMLTVFQTKILEMNVSLGKQLSSCVDKGLDKIIILLSSYPTVAKTKIELVFKQIFVVSAAVYDDGKGSTGMNAGAEGRKSQLCS